MSTPDVDPNSTCLDFFNSLLGTRLLRKPYNFAELIREVEAGFTRMEQEPSATPILPSGVPPHNRVELGNGAGAIAARTTEPDKS